MSAGLGAGAFNAEAQRTQSKTRKKRLFYFFSAALCVLCASALKGISPGSLP
jgi:hypothetical protein